MSATPSSSYEYQVGGSLPIDACPQLCDATLEPEGESQPGRRRGRLFPQYKFPPEEIARRNALRETVYKRCRAVFEQVRPELIDDHYNWFIIIEPDTGDYIIDTDAGRKLTETETDN